MGHLSCSDSEYSDGCGAMRHCTDCTHGSLLEKQESETIEQESINCCWSVVCGGDLGGGVALWDGCGRSEGGDRIGAKDLCGHGDESFGAIAFD